jgi:hypothetical protein
MTDSHSRSPIAPGLIGPAHGVDEKHGRQDASTSTGRRLPSRNFPNCSSMPGRRQRLRRPSPAARRPSRHGRTARTRARAQHSTAQRIGQGAKPPRATHGPPKCLRGLAAVSPAADRRSEVTVHEEMERCAGVLRPPIARRARGVESRRVLLLAPECERLARRSSNDRNGRAPSAPDRPPVTPAPSGRSRRLCEIDARSRRSSQAGVCRGSSETPAHRANAEARGSDGAGVGP